MGPLGLPPSLPVSPLQRPALALTDPVPHAMGAGTWGEVCSQVYLSQLPSISQREQQLLPGQGASVELGGGRAPGPFPQRGASPATGQWQRLVACEPGPHLVGPAGGNSWAHVLRASLSFQQMLRPSVQQLGAPSLGRTARRVSFCSPKHSCPRWDGAGGVEREGELVPPQKKQGTQARISQRTEPHALLD